MSEDIKQSFVNQAARDKFKLVFDIPPILKEIQSKYVRGNETILPDTVQFTIYGTAVPEVTVPGVEVNYAGSTLYVSSHAKNPYPPIEVKFAVDSQYNNYWCIYQWLNLLHDEKRGTYNTRNIQVDGNFLDYQTNLTIFGLDEYGNERIKWTYTKAFPTSVKGIEYDHQADGDVRIDSGFTFVYSQIHTEMVDLQ